MQDYSDCDSEFAASYIAYTEDAALLQNSKENIKVTNKDDGQVLYNVYPYLAVCSAPGLYSADGGLIKSWSEIVDDLEVNVVDGELTYYFTNESSACKLILDDELISIGDGSFSGNANNVLTSIIIPGSITSIGDRAFYGLTGLTTITLPESITTIGESAFENCTGLTGELVLPDSLDSLGKSAFNSCTSLTSLVIGDGLEFVGWASFFECTGLTNITFGNNVKGFELNAFAYCSGLKTINLPNSVTSIGNSAFAFCVGLTSVTIPNSVTSIGTGAFDSCTSLTSVTIPDSVTSIGEEAFFRCESLTSITIPNSVTSIGVDAFSYCSGLSSLYVDSSNPTYYSSNNCIIEKTTKKLVLGCKNSTIPSDITIIGEGAFAGVTGLTTITIPSNVTSIEKEAFCGCSSILEYDFSNHTSIPTLGSSVFYGINSSCKIYVPANLYSSWKQATNWSTYADYITTEPVKIYFNISLNTAHGSDLYILKNGEMVEYTAPYAHGGYFTVSAGDVIEVCMTDAKKASIGINYGFRVSMGSYSVTKSNPFEWISDLTVTINVDKLFANSTYTLDISSTTISTPVLV